MSESLKIVFQNDFFALVDKPSGYLSVPSRFPDQDKRLVVGVELEKKLDRQIFPVHRLDCEVSGLLLFALTPEAHREANQIFEKHQVQKTYQALATKILATRSTDEKMKVRVVNPEIGEVFTWKTKVLRGKKRSYESPHGKSSITEAEYRGVKDQRHCWSLKPITGRAHQLRFDLARHGFPILGDVLYGGEVIKEEEMIFLRACHIQFSKKEFCQRFKMPEEFSIQGYF